MRNLTTRVHFSRQKDLANLCGFWLKSDPKRPQIRQILPSGRFWLFSVATPYSLKLNLLTTICEHECTLRRQSQLRILCPKSLAVPKFDVAGNTQPQLTHRNAMILCVETLQYFTHSKYKKEGSINSSLRPEYTADGGQIEAIPRRFWNVSRFHIKSVLHHIKACANIHFYNADNTSDKCQTSFPFIRYRFLQPRSSATFLSCGQGHVSALRPSVDSLFWM